MTGKKALINALIDYIVSNGNTKFDTERKVNLAQEYLKELNEMETVTYEWFISKSSMMHRIVLNRRLSIEKYLNDSPHDEDNNILKEEYRVLAQIAALLKDYSELPL